MKKMQYCLKRWQKTGIVAVLFIVVLFLMICTHFDQESDSAFEFASEAIVMGPIYADESGLNIDTGGGYGLGALFVNGEAQWSYYYLRGGDGPEKPAPGASSYYEIYASQIGAQGWFFRLLAQKIPSPKKYLLFRGMCIGALDLILLLLCLQIRRRYGNMMAGCYLAVFIGSPWIAKFSANLYWVEFTWFLPALLGLLCLNYPRKRFLFYPLIYLCIVLRTMCGYEYITTIMVSVISFMCAEWIARKEERKNLTGMIFAAGIACLLGFVTTLTIHGYIAGNGDAASGIRSIVENIAVRVTWGGAWGGSSHVLPVIAKYVWQKLAGKATLCILLLVSGIFILQWRLYGKTDTMTLALFLLNVFGAVSWFALAKGHSFVHPHLNFVLWYMGTIQMAVYIIVKFIWNHKTDILSFWNSSTQERE